MQGWFVYHFYGNIIIQDIIVKQNDGRGWSDINKEIENNLHLHLTSSYISRPLDLPTWSEIQERFIVIQQWCDEGALPDWIVFGTRGLIWSLIAPDLLSCLLGCIFDACTATLELLAAIALFLTGVAFPIALAMSGVTGVQYGIAIACWNICITRFGG